jgi:antirestriction protein ArdC
MNKLYSDITDAILAQLEKGVVPWRRNWVGANTGIPANAISGYRYRGVNVPLLWLAQQRNNWPTLKFLTYKQAREAGGRVRGGQKATAIVFTKALEIEDKTTGEKKTVPLLRGFRVFNIAKCDGLPEKITNPDAASTPRNHDGRDPGIDAFVSASGVPVHEGAGFPAYYPKTDKITMPKFEAFDDAHCFYATLLHELTHATGHESRCNRTQSVAVKMYALEELIAELGASFLSAEFGLDNAKEAAAYIDSWLNVLKADNKAFVRAASAAQAACDWLRGKALAEAQEAA